MAISCDKTGELFAGLYPCQVFERLYKKNGCSYFSFMNTFLHVGKFNITTDEARTTCYQQDMNKTAATQVHVINKK